MHMYFHVALFTASPSSPRAHHFFTHDLFTPRQKCRRGISDVGSKVVTKIASEEEGEPGDETRCYDEFGVLYAIPG